MTEKPLVSVIINCYNSEKYLRETIDSLIAQTYENWEAIFWDNCSSDKTAEIINSYNEPRFRYYLAEKNTPLGKARNLAMEKVSGEYLCFLDSDDIWEPMFLENCSTILSNNEDVGLVYTRYTHFSDTAKWLSRGIGNSGIIEISRLINGYNIGLSAALFKKSIVREKYLLFDTRFSLIEDFDFFLKLACRTKVYYINLSLMNYRHHSHQSSNSNKWIEEYDMMINNIQSCKDYYPLMQYCDSIKKLQGRYKIMTAINQGERFVALKNVFSQLWRYPSVLCYLLPIFGGKKIYALIIRTLGVFRHL